MKSLTDDTTTVVISVRPYNSFWWNVSSLEHYQVQKIFHESPPFNGKVKDTMVAYIMEIKQ